MTENDYVATATAEKRLREVLADKLGRDYEIDELADLLLAGAEITYLPRKKSVSITLRVPETAPTPKASQNGDGAATPPADDPTPTAVAAAADPAVESATPAPSPRVARFGEFVPSVTSAPEYHEDDYFTE